MPTLHLDLVTRFGLWASIWKLKRPETPTKKNAALKARAFAAGIRPPLTLADDSGLEVDALGGAPGVRSARYSSSTGSDSDNVDLLLKNLTDCPGTGIPHRSFRLRSGRYHGPSGEMDYARGECEGTIGEGRRREIVRASGTTPYSSTGRTETLPWPNSPPKEKKSHQPPRPGSP